MPILRSYDPTSNTIRIRSNLFFIPIIVQSYDDLYNRRFIFFYLKNIPFHWFTWIYLVLKNEVSILVYEYHLLEALPAGGLSIAWRWDGNVQSNKYLQLIFYFLTINRFHFSGFSTPNIPIPLKVKGSCKICNLMWVSFSNLSTFHPYFLLLYSLSSLPTGARSDSS